jgi:hypothetical protein
VAAQGIWGDAGNLSSQDLGFRVRGVQEAEDWLASPNPLNTGGRNHKWKLTYIYIWNSSQFPDTQLLKALESLKQGSFVC